MARHCISRIKHGVRIALCVSDKLELRRGARAVSISSLTISNTRRNVTLNISPNGFPATRLVAKRSAVDEAPTSYIQVLSNSPSRRVALIPWTGP